MRNKEITPTFREGFSPFIAEDPSGLNGLAYKDILGLSDDEFSERFLGEMTRSFYELARGRLEMESNLKGMTVKSREGLISVSCHGCNGSIDGANDLVRFYGINLHYDCFVERWEKERNDDLNKPTWVTQYWDRISKMIREE